MRAIDLSERTGADLHLLHADVLHADTVAIARAEAEAATVDAVRRRLCLGPDGEELEAHGQVIAAAVRDVAAGPAIVRYAEEHDIELIVMGTHGRRGIRRLLLGSVTEEVLRTAPCEILAVRQGSPPVGARPIMAAVDFSESSRKALVRARELAHLYQTRLLVLHVAAVVPYPSFFEADASSRHELPPEVAERARRNLAEFVESTGGPEIDTTETRVLVGEPFRRIIDVAQEQDAGILVMGRRGLTGLASILVGSTTERVLRLARCAVLVTRLPDSSFRASPDDRPSLD